jgi:hypothetical protein
MRTYAKDTTVGVTASRIEIEATLKGWGAEDAIAAPFRGKAAVIFTYGNKRIRFTADIPTEVLTPTGRRARHMNKAVEQAEKEVWRLLLLKIKGKIASVGHNVNEFETEFMPYMVTPNGQTIAELIHPQIEQMYRNGIMPSGLLMLEGPKE